MKQGEKFIRLIMILLAAVVLAYFGYAAYGYLAAPLTTVTALEYEASVGVTAAGYVVRQETQLTSSYPITVPTLAEGARIGKGQTLAVTYSSEGAQQRQAEIANLQQQIAQLTYACKDSGDPTSLDADLSDLLTTYAMRTTLRQTGASDDLSTELKGTLLRSGADADALAALRSELSALQSQLDTLTDENNSGTSELTANTPGYFSGSADGYESVLSPEILDTMTLSDFSQLPSAAQTVSDQVYGKLIASDVWYFVTAVPEDQLTDVEEGDSVRLTFAKDAYLEITMTVQRIGPSEDGKQLLVLSGGNYIQNVTLLREQTCNLTFQTYDGLRVPKKAIHIDSETGQAGVYVLEGAVARWKPVTVLYAASDNYVVELDESSTGNLWPGDEILLASGLYDGKVVNQK
ncbi:MAG: HlyD family efflux transporter periplasmic adaptor subunit [Oscillospiraceae bacterium]|nr:HlyD family efflux transporter periplasmic adaptor subunit [Oscillospiraceae bacterium]